MSLSKPVRHCPSSCRSCATFAAIGGGYFPFQPPGSPLADCYEYAQALGIIDPPMNSTSDLDANLMPAPLSIPAKSSRRPVGKPLNPSEANRVETAVKKVVAAMEEGSGEFLEDGVDFETGLKQPMVNLATKSKAPEGNDARKSVPFKLHLTPKSASSSKTTYSALSREELAANAKFPLGHTFVPPGVVPLPNDPLFTVTTCGERNATTFVGTYAMRMYDAYRASGVDMRIHEVKGEWEKAGVKRWMLSLGEDRDIGRVTKVLATGKDFVVAAGREKLSTHKLLKEYDDMGVEVNKNVEMGKALREGRYEVKGRGWGRQPLVDGPLNAEAMWRVIQTVFKIKFDPMDWEGPKWMGGEASISALPPRQRPLWIGCDMSGVIIDDENDETACTTYVRLGPTKQLDFSWYERRDEKNRTEHQWPHIVKWTTSDGTIRQFSMQQVYDGLTSKYSDIKRRLNNEYCIEFLDKYTLGLLGIHWRNLANEMTTFDWFWDKDKRILVQGYSGINDYERDCDLIDEQLDQWMESVKDELKANNKAIRSGNLTKKELRWAVIGGQLLRQWKAGPGIMVSKTPSDETVEGSLLGPHTTDGASHINYLSARIAAATRQREEIERTWSVDTITDEVSAQRRELVKHIDVLDNLRFDIMEENELEETGQSPIFKDRKTRRELSLWQREQREEMRLWEKKPQEEEKEQSPDFEGYNFSQTTEEAMKLMEEMCGTNDAA